jgi:putative transposase
VGLTRRRSLRVPQRDEGLLPRMAALKANQPFWGDRRLWAYGRCVEHVPVHTNRLGRLLREPPLRAPPQRRLRATRTPTGSKPRPTTPHEWWGSEMPQVMVTGCGGLSLVVGLAWYPQRSVGD